MFPRWKKLGFCAPVEHRWQLGLKYEDYLSSIPLLDFGLEVL